LAGASAGASAGGALGGVTCYHLGGVLSNAFENLSNPLKARYLNAIRNESPAIFEAFRKYLGDAEIAKLTRLRLPEGKRVFEMGPGYKADTTRLMPQDEARARLLPQEILAESNKKLLMAPTVRYVGPTQGGKPFTPNPNVDSRRIFRGSQE
jgi:hypothetical protein